MDGRRKDDPKTQCLFPPIVGGGGKKTERAKLDNSNRHLSKKSSSICIEAAEVDILDTVSDCHIVLITTTMNVSTR